MPNVSESILNKIGLSINKLNLNDIQNNEIIDFKYKIQKPEIIFKKIDE